MGNNNNKGKYGIFIQYTFALTTTTVRKVDLNNKIVIAGTSKTGVKYKGYVEIPNLSDENDIDEIEVSTTGCMEHFNRNTHSINISFPVTFFRTFV